MKKIFFAFLFCFTILIIKAQNTVSVVSIYGYRINNFLDTSPDGLMILSFIVDTANAAGTNLIAEAFGYNRNGSTGHKFVTSLPLTVERSLNPLHFSPHDTIHVVTLRWRYDEDAPNDFEFEDSTKYFFIPTIQRKLGRNFIVYTVSKNSPTMAPINSYNFANETEKLNAFRNLYRTAASQGGNFNPIPPKLVP